METISKYNLHGIDYVKLTELNDLIREMKKKAQAGTEPGYIEPDEGRRMSAMLALNHLGAALMSSLIMFSSESKRYSASDFASWVFPTPVGPKNMNVPIGLPGSLMPALLRWIARTTFSMASSCPMMRS